MSQQKKTLLLLLIAAVISQCIFAKPLLDNAVDMDIDLEAEESHYVAHHHVIKQIFLPRGYSGYSPYRNHHDWSSEEDSDEDDDRHHSGHGYGGFTHYGQHGFHHHGQASSGIYVHKPVPKGDCKGPVLSTTTVKPTAKVQVTTTRTTKTRPSNPPPTTTIATQKPNTMASPRNPVESSSGSPATDEPFLDIDLRFGGASQK